MQHIRKHELIQSNNSYFRYYYLTPKKEWLSNISNLAPKWLASAFTNISWYISDPTKSSKQNYILLFSILNVNQYNFQNKYVGHKFPQTCRTRKQNSWVHSGELWCKFCMFSMLQMYIWGSNQNILRIFTAK